MLVLSRKNLEAVVVGGSTGFESLLKVTVLEINGGSVRLGFEVDPAVPVHRPGGGRRRRLPFRTGLLGLRTARWVKAEPGRV